VASGTSKIIVKTKDIPSLKFSSEQAALYYNGIDISPVGNTILELNGDSLTAYSASGETTGVSIDLGEALRFDAAWDYPSQGEFDENVDVTINYYGGGTGYSDYLISSHSAKKIGDELVLSADFSYVGATEQTVVIWLEDSVQAEDYNNVFPQVFVSWPYPWPYPWPDPLPRDDHWPFPTGWSGLKAGGHGCWPTWPDPIDFPDFKKDGKAITGDMLGFIPEDDTLDIEYLSKVEFLITGIPSITFTEILTLAPCNCQPGNANGDAGVNILDITYLIGYLYKGGPAPSCMYNGDPNASCSINILDVTSLINYLYKSGSAPVCAENCPGW
jgi:hypothetical protein